MNRLKYFALAALVAFAACGQGLAAQVTDSVTIEVLSPPTSVQIQAPQRAYVGDTITVFYNIVSGDGVPAEGVATWTTNPDRATIIEQTDSTVSVTFQRPGPVTLIVSVERVQYQVLGGRYLVPGTDPVLGAVEPGTFRWATDGNDISDWAVEIPDGPVPEGGYDVLQLCSVGFSSEGRPLFVSNDDCYENLPALLGPGSLPALSNIRRAEGLYPLDAILLRPEWGVIAQAAVGQ